MSENNRDAKNNARERMRQERELREARSRRRRLLAVLGAGVAVLAVAAVVGVLVSDNTGGQGDAGSGKPVATPRGAAGGDRLVIPVGKPGAKATLTVYEDFRCPACGQFERTFHTTVDKLEKQGKLKVDYHIVSFIDNNVGGSGSKVAANAAACSQHVGAFPEYHDVLYANQPQETQDGFGNKDKVVAVGGKVPALKDNPAFASCVRGGTYDGWVRKAQSAFDKSGYNSTPTILLNGRNVSADQKNPLTPAKLEAEVNKLNS